MVFVIKEFDNSRGRYERKREKEARETVGVKRLEKYSKQR